MNTNMRNEFAGEILCMEKYRFADKMLIDEVIKDFCRLMAENKTTSDDELLKSKIADIEKRLFKIGKSVETLNEFRLIDAICFELRELSKK